MAAEVLQPGETFAGYTVERVIGTGGMAAVYLATHHNLPRKVALKVLTDPIEGDSEARARFRSEADHVARLEHPNIVVIYDRGETDGRMWIAMQYVPGADARVASQEAEFDIKLAVRIVAATSIALDFAHSKGVLHRDVKPSNILLREPCSSENSHVMLTDFGIAKSLAESRSITKSGLIFGSLPYCSPEQIRSQPLDGATDQYALACTLYQLLTGSPPFTGDQIGVMNAHLCSAPPRLADINPRLAPFDDALSVALRKHPDQRFGSCGEFSAAVHDAFRTVESRRGIVSSAPTIVTVGRTSSAAPTSATPAAPGDRLQSPTTTTPPVPVSQSAKRTSLRWPLRLTAAAVLIAVLGFGVWLAVRKSPEQASPTPISVSGLNFPVGLHNADNGRIYIADTGNSRIVVFDPVAQTQSVLGLTGLKEPADVAVAIDGTVFVADTKNDRVVSWDGKKQQTVDLGGLRRPSGVAVDTNGGLYVTDTGNRRVLFMRPGSPVETLGFTGLVGPVGVAVADGQVVVTEPSAGRALRLTARGQSEETGLARPIGVALDGDDLYIAENGSARLTLIADGRRSAVVDDDLLSPSGVAAASGGGTVYVVDSAANQVFAVKP